jgi:hypothetical protein
VSCHVVIVTTSSVPVKWREIPTPPASRRGACALRRRPRAAGGRVYNARARSRVALVVLIALAPLLLRAQAGPPTLTSRGAADITSYLRDVVKRGAVLMIQVLPFYDERAIDVLRGFEQRIYRNLVLSSAPSKS